MKLAILGPVSWRTPPHHYGAWETVVTNLAEGLGARGYDVTLYATADSLTRNRLEAVVPRPYSEDETLDPKVWEALHISSFMERADEFDLLHNNFDFLPLTYSRLIPTPMVTTVHGFSIDQFRLVYRKYRETFFVSISNADRDPYLPYVATVYNGIRLEDFTFNPDPDDYLAFVGRIHPDKGVHLAVELARRLGMKLVIAGIIQDQRYFDDSIAPYLDSNIQFIGPVGPPERDRLLRHALASLHLTTIPERFGLAMVESMATGTPVIGIGLGSVPEVIDDGVTGFVVQDVDDATRRVARLESIERRACRRRVEEQFSVDSMVDGYVNVYAQILGDRVRITGSGC